MIKNTQIKNKQSNQSKNQSKLLSQQQQIMLNSLLQKSFQNLTCMHEGHQQQPLDYVCVEFDCQCAQRVMCYLCSLQIHVDHQKVPIKIFLKQLMTVEKRSQNVTSLCAQIDSIFNKIKTKITQHFEEFTHPQLVMRTFQQYRQIQIQSLLDFYIMTEKVAQLFKQADSSKLVDRLNWFVKNMYTKYLSDVEPSGWANVDITETVLSKKIQAMNDISELLQKSLAFHNVNESVVLNLFPLVVQEQKKIRVYFSQQLMPKNMKMLSTSQTKMLTSGSERLVILQPCLSSNFQLIEETQSVKKWGVRIIKLASWIGVGVCHINAIKKAAYVFNYSNTGHGNYLISSNGYAWSSYQKEYNSKFEPFTYTTGDVIHIEYSPREHMVRFKKESDPNQPTYMLAIESNEDPIHPEINLTGVNDEVELINF